MKKTKKPMYDPQAEREAKRYDRPIPSREAILAFLSDAGALLKDVHIAEGLGLHDPVDVDALQKRLSAMVRDGQLHRNRRDGYGVARKLDIKAGVVLANPEGFAFVRLDEGGDDVFLSPWQARGVMHGDRVTVSVVGLDRRGRPEGAVTEVLERRTTRIVGRFDERDGICLVIPDDRRLHADIAVPPRATGGARPGQIVVCEITEPPSQHRPAKGEIVAVLGEKLTPSLVVEMAIHSHGLRNEWPEAVQDQVARVPTSVGAAEIQGRTDLRSLPLVTIDGEDAKDFDDAVYCEPNGSGFRLIVAIADVSHYVTPGSALDQEAVLRATSVYFPGYVVPMLPEMLSNGICSLKPKVDRMCFVCDMRVDHEGEVTRSRFYPAVMRSHARLTYDQVWAACGEKQAEARETVGETLLPHLENLFRLYRVFAKRRRARGAIEFESRETLFRLGPDGRVLSLGGYQRNDAHKLIEECMIAANVEAARFLQRKRIPAPYRVHDRPPASKYEALLEFLQEFKLRLPPQHEVTPGDFSALLRRVRKRGDDTTLIESVLLRAQALAVYQPENLGHFGLALDAYAHFTSPIRRYPDLLVHRAIAHALSGGRAADAPYSEEEMGRLSAQCSRQERVAEEAEREVDERYRCAWMEEHIGSEFDGVVTGVTSFGLFVDLVESGVTGLVHVTQLPNDYYHFEPVRHLLSGERRGLAFRLGDAVRVQVLRASLEDRKIDFRLVTADGSHEDVEKPLPKKAGARRGAGSKVAKVKAKPDEAKTGKRRRRR
ncbi:MAG TPA: ribonuclease R [Xanthomonadaceae bacterium]|nr:ribonuclease R [Xanthomonadaceae bacterium]